VAELFNNKSESISDSWIKDIKKTNVHQNPPISIMLPAKLIIFAWAYATYQTHELKNRFGNINFVECLEQIFLNKMAELTIALHMGYHDGDILSGQSFVRLDPSSFDERYNILLPALMKGKSVSVTGVKKFTYPTIERNPGTSHVFVYIDATRFRSGTQTISRINIQNGCKATIIGYGSRTDLKTHQNQSMLASYSNKYSAFVGFDVLKPINEIDFSKRMFAVPKYVSEIACCDNMDTKINEIVTYLKNISDVKPIVQLDYAAIFDPIIK
jgi:hypothetical protein